MFDIITDGSICEEPLCNDASQDNLTGSTENLLNCTNNYKKNYSHLKDVEECLTSSEGEVFIDENTQLINVTGDISIPINNCTLIHNGKFVVSFGKISGSFDCSGCNLHSLEGCPTKVTENFNCGNNKLSSLKHAPAYVGGNFYCYCNDLTSLSASTIYIEGNFDCSRLRNKKFSESDFNKLNVKGKIIH